MQIQTTTVTTETMEVEAVNFQIKTYEQTLTAFCDCCDASAKGTKESLLNRGWSFGKGSEFCPECF